MTIALSIVPLSVVAMLSSAYQNDTGFQRTVWTVNISPFSITFLS